MIPRLVWKPRLLTRHFEFIVRCRVCPMPHPVILCETHGRPFAVSIPEYYNAPKGATCQICEKIEEMKAQHGEDQEMLGRLLKDLDGLLTAVLRFRVRRGESGFAI
jgi:hypothetical protein